ncbi:MAG: hypothetical protein ABIO24_09765 [Saprospiraceae bacterium]
MKNIDDELRKISPFLRDLKARGDGFQSPPGYFDALENQVFDRLEQLEPRQPLTGWRTTTGGRLRRWLLQTRTLTAMAAGLVLIAAALWFFKPTTVVEQQSTLAQVSMPELSEAEIESYVLENIREFDTEQLAALPPVVVVDHGPELPPSSTPHRTKRQQALDNVRPEDLENLLNDLSDEDLEKLL